MFVGSNLLRHLRLLLFLLDLVLSLLLAEPHHGHLQLDHEQVDLALLDELRQCGQHAVLGELLRREDEALGGQVADGAVEDLEGEQFLDERVIFEEGGLERGDHAVLVDQSSLPGEVLVDD